MNIISTPNVYLKSAQEPPAPHKRLTSITGFIGLAPRGPLNVPQRLENWGQFISIFGPLSNNHYLGPAVYGFYSNGGEICYTVRVGQDQKAGGKLRSAQYTARNALGEPVIVVEAANEGTWGNEFERLELSQSKEKMLLTRLAARAVAGIDEIELTTTTDMYPGGQITLVNAADAGIRQEFTVIDVLPGNRVALESTLDQDYPQHSLVLGYSLNLTVLWGDRLESYANLSLSALHSRYIMDIVNGDPLVNSYVQKTANGNSILVRITNPGTSPIGHWRPIKGCDNDAFIRISPFTLPAGVTFPLELADKIEFHPSDSGTLIFKGAMSLGERNTLLSLSPETSYQLGIVNLFENSQIVSRTPLAALPAELALPDDLAGKIEFDSSGGGSLVFVGPMSSGERERLLELSPVTEYQSAIKQLFISSQVLGRHAEGRDPDPGAELNVRYFTGYDLSGYFPNSDPYRDGFQGLASLELIEEIDLVAIPDLSHADPDLNGDSAFAIGQRQILNHCEKSGDRFAILDSPKQADDVHDPVGQLISDHWTNFEFLPANANGALYYPWIKMLPFEDRDVDQFIPPCGFVAGVYARTDFYEGVHRAPANEIIRDVFELQFTVDDNCQDRLNNAGINCIRAFPGRGIRIWGARTLGKNVQWRYINVRRMMLIVKKQIRNSLRWAVFEPNNDRLRSSIAGALNSYLNSLYEANILAGESPEEAYFVTCNEVSNPPGSMQRGEVFAEVGFAPLYPAEFIVVTIKRTAESIQVAETS